MNKDLAKKTDVSIYKFLWKRLPRNIKIKKPAMQEEDKNSLGIYYGTYESSPVVLKCYDNKNFTISSEINNTFRILAGSSARLILTSKHRYYMAPFCNAGNLKNLIDRNIRFTEEQVARFILQIAQYLSKLKEKGLYHGELCPENILIHIENDGSYTYKICGLGRWRKKPKEYYYRDEFKHYLSPESIENPHETHNTSCDMWSLGILAYKLVTGDFPEMDKEIEYGYLKILPNKSISPMLNYFCSRCLFIKPQCRVCPENVEYQPFFIPVSEDMKGYILGEELGSGISGRVYKANSKKNPNTTFAIKQLHDIGSRDTKKLILFFSESCIFRILRDSAYTVKLIDCFKYENQVNLVLEYLNGGDLLDYWKRYTKELRNKEIDEQDANMEMQEIIWQVTHTLAYGLNDIHKKDIMHRDINPRNLLLTLNNETKRVSAVRITDFGVSKELMPGHELRSQVGSNKYMAREVLYGQYTRSADIYSAGRVLHMMAYGNPLFFNDEEKTDVIYKVPECYLDLMKGCIEIEAEKRISIKDMINSKYLNTAPCLTLKSFPKNYELSGKVIFGNEAWVVREITYLPTKTKLLVKILKGAYNLTKDVIDKGIRDLIVLRHCTDIFTMHQSFIFNDDYYFILDYTERKTLKDFIIAQKGTRMQPQYIRKFAYGLARAIFEIHAVKLSHERISANWMYIVNDKDGSPNVKLVYDEVIQGVSELDIRIDDKKDTYKFGEVLYYMIFGNTSPYSKCMDDNIADTLLKQLKDSEELKIAFDLVQKCVEETYYLPSMILEDKYFTCKSIA